MKEKIILMLKGAIIGVANIIPGASGGTLAITLGLYEKIIHVINNLFKDFKNNFKFLFFFGIGIMFSLLLMSNIIVYFLDKFPIPTTIFLVGLILGGLPIIIQKVKGKKFKFSNILIFSIVLLFLVSLSLIKHGNNVVSFDNLNVIGYFKLFIVGIIAAATMVVPGLSGSFVLMLIGYYRPILEAINNLTDFQTLNFHIFISNAVILFVFGMGVLLGILIIAKVIKYLLMRFEVPTYYAIIAFVIGSIYVILTPLLTYDLTWPIIFTSIICGIVGYVIAYFLGER